MRIGMISAEYPPAVGGVGDQTARLAQELVAVGHTVHVVTSAGPPQPLDLGPGRPRVIRCVRRWDWCILTTLPRLARRSAWDVLHIQYQTAAYGLHPAINLLPAFVRRARDAPAIVTTFHDLRVPYLFPKAGPLRRWAVRLLARGSDGIIAVAEEDLPALLAWTVGTGGRAAVERVPLGNPLEAEPPPDFDRAAWRARLGVGPSAFLAGHYGFVNRSKAVDALVEAIALLAESGREVHLLMLGDEVGTADRSNRAYLEEVRRLITARRLETRVHWTGYQEPAALAAWLRCLDVAVLPFRDGASLRRTTLIAAWTNGVPVVTTAPARPVDWLRERDAAPALALPAPQPTALARALLELQDDPARRVALSAAGRAFASRFSWPLVARRTLDLYRAARAARR